MARTPRSAGTQNTLGPVGMAVLPTDPVPLEQAASSNIIWISKSGRKVSQTTPYKWNWTWNAEGPLDFQTNFPVNVPYALRLKEVAWHYNGYALNIFRNNHIVATIQPNSVNEFNLLWQYDTSCYLRTTATTNQAFSWDLTMRWEKIGDMQEVTKPVEEPGTQAFPDPIAEVLAPIPQIEQPLAATKPIAAKGSNRFSSWIKRRFR